MGPASARFAAENFPCSGVDDTGTSGIAACAALHCAGLDAAHSVAATTAGNADPGAKGSEESHMSFSEYVAGTADPRAAWGVVRACKVPSRTSAARTVQRGAVAMVYRRSRV